MSAVTDAVTGEVRRDADVRVALEAVQTVEGTGVLESRDHESEPIILRSPGVGAVPQGHEVGAGYYKTVRTDRIGR